MQSALRLGAVLLALVWLPGCSIDNVSSNDVKPGVIYQIYSITHDAETASTHAYARFRVGGATGTNVILTANAAVTCDHLPLRQTNFFGVCYGQALQGFEGDHEFVYRDADGKTYRNAVHLEGLDFDAATPARLRRSQNHTVAFAGPPLRAGEMVVLNVLQTPTNGAAQPPAEADPAADPTKKGRFSASGQTRTVGATAVELTAAELRSLRDGPAMLQWTRVYNGSLAEATPTGGAITGSYVSTRRPVTLEK